MGVSEGHAGSRPGQAAWAAAAGTQGRGLVLASAPDSIRSQVFPVWTQSPTQAHCKRDQGTTCGRTWNSTFLGYTTQHPSLKPGYSWTQLCPVHLHPTTSVTMCSPSCKMVAGSAGCGSVRCQPRRSSWCRHLQSSAPQRPPDGPGVHMTGWRLRGQEAGRLRDSSLILLMPPPSFWPLTLTFLTAAAIFEHPAMGT